MRRLITNGDQRTRTRGAPAVVSAVPSGLVGKRCSRLILHMFSKSRDRFRSDGRPVRRRRCIFTPVDQRRPQSDGYRLPLKTAAITIVG